MAVCILRVFFLAALVLLPEQADAVQVRAGTSMTNKNPMRKVIVMLQKMQTDIKKEGQDEETLFHKFNCSCTTTYARLEKEIKEAERQISMLVADIARDKATYNNLVREIEDETKQRDDAQAKLDAAKQKRLEEKTAYETKHANDLKNTEAIKMAVNALRQGMGTVFLQSPAASLLKQLSVSMNDISDMDRDHLASFLSARSSEEYSPRSGEIVGILTQLSDEMKKEMTEDTAAENLAQKEFEALEKALLDQIALLNASIRSKTLQANELAVKIAEMEEEKRKLEDFVDRCKILLADTKKNCEEKQAVHLKNQEIRSDELATIADAIKLLNDDDALEMFKKTLDNSAKSFLQVSVDKRRRRKHALSALDKASAKDNRLNLIMLMLKNKKVNFENVKAAIDEMIGILEADQVKDNAFKEKCIQEERDAKEDKFLLETQLEQLNKTIETHEDAIAVLNEKIRAKQEKIDADNATMKEMRIRREEEHNLYLEVRARDLEARALIGQAKNRLAKFYTPETYKPPPETVLTMAQTSDDEAPAASFMQVRSHRKDDEEKEGEEATADEAKSEADKHLETINKYNPDYAKQTSQHMGVVTMLDLFVAELNKELSFDEGAEKDAQSAYEELIEKMEFDMQLDFQLIDNYKSDKANEEEPLNQARIDYDSKNEEYMGVLEKLRDIAARCEWFVAHFDQIVRARDGEIQALKDAKAVLNGADISVETKYNSVQEEEGGAFLQMSVRHRRIRR